MAITDPRAVIFCNEVVRVLSRRLDAVFADIDDALDRWDDDINPLIPNDANEKVVDGRTDGAPELDGQEITRFIRRLRDIQTLYGGTTTGISDTPQFRQQIERPNPTTLRRQIA